MKRLRALTTTLLPVEVTTQSLNDPTSRIITPQVIDTYMTAAGDFTEAASVGHFCVPARLIPIHDTVTILFAEGKGRVYVGC